MLCVGGFYKYFHKRKLFCMLLACLRIALAGKLNLLPPRTNMISIFPGLETRNKKLNYVRMNCVCVLVLRGMECKIDS